MAPTVDAHMHLNGTLADPARYPRLTDQPGARAMTCFRWFGDSGPPEGDATIEMLRRRMAGTPQQPIDRAVNVTPGWCGWDNSYTMDTLKANRDWLAATVLVDPIADSGPATLRHLESGGASGLRIQPPCTGPLTDPRQAPIWQCASELGLTVQCNLPQKFLLESVLGRAGPGPPTARSEKVATSGQFMEPGYAQVAQRAREFPGVNIVLDHCGWMSGATPTSVASVIELASFSNVYAKLTFGRPQGVGTLPGPVPFAEAAPMMRQVMDAFGSSRCLAASNFCGDSQAEYNNAWKLYRSDFVCTDDERADLCGGVASKLFRWKQPSQGKL
jgi:predicted TIM-barrel fold metal-dependent hydrolase